MAIQKRMVDVAKEDVQQRQFFTGPTTRATATKKPKLAQYVMRLETADYDRLREHFQRKGLSIASGVRMIVKDYLDREAR